jgi:hypothetical protein
LLLLLGTLDANYLLVRGMHRSQRRRASVHNGIAIAFDVLHTA